VGVDLAGYVSDAEYGIDGALTYLFSTHCDCAIALYVSMCDLSSSLREVVDEEN